MSTLKATADKRQAENVDITMEMTFTLKEWQEIAEAVKPHTYIGPAGTLFHGIRRISERMTKAYTEDLANHIPS